MELPAIASMRPADSPPPERAARDAALRDKAQEFEAVFLGLMLKQVGLGAARDSFGGGEGEAAYSDMLAQQQARALAQSGGLGLAEPIYQALLAADGAHD